MSLFQSSFSKPAHKLVQRFMEKTQMTLPLDYQKFLIEVNGGFSANFYPQSSLSQQIIEIDILFGLCQGSLEHGISGSTDRDEDLYLQYDVYQVTHDYPSFLIAIGTSPILTVLMSLQPSNFGKIYCGSPGAGKEILYDEKRASATSLDEELDYLGFRPFAASFSEFLNSSTCDTEMWYQKKYF
jgi:hypothetical protein